MSVALLEAMASGLAVLVTPTGGTPELVQPEINGLIFNWADRGLLNSASAPIGARPGAGATHGRRSRRGAGDFSWDDGRSTIFGNIHAIIRRFSRRQSHFNMEAKTKSILCAASVVTRFRIPAQSRGRANFCSK